MLEQLQVDMMQALDNGPDFLPDRLFAGPHQRVLAGMKVHANTISHARLVALEDTFPRTLELLGHTRFNEHSRLYIRRPGVTAVALGNIGYGFGDFLAEQAEHLAADLARFEWSWLASFHAADAEPLKLADLAGIEPDELPGVPVIAHPAARLVRQEPATIARLGLPPIDDTTDPALLIVRPKAEVRIVRPSAAMARLFEQAEECINIGNLLTASHEQGVKDQLSPEDLMPALIALIEAGALRECPTCELC